MPLPTSISKYTVVRSPFIDKDSREQFEMRTHKRIVDILDPNPKVVDALMRLNLPSGVNIANRRFVGMPMLTLGAALNVLAITVNGGVMPAWSTAIRLAGLDEKAGFDNSAPVSHAHLQVLGDVIPVPGPWPIGNVLSIGDLLIFAGAFILLHHACASRLALRRPVRA